MNAPYRSKKPCRALEYWLLPFNVQWLNTANNAKTFNLLLVFFCYKFNGSFKPINRLIYGLIGSLPQLLAVCCVLGALQGVA